MGVPMISREEPPVQHTPVAVPGHLFNACFTSVDVEDQSRAAAFPGSGLDSPLIL